MDENFPAFGASICHENYRLRAVIRHSPYSCQHPLTRKTCNNHSGSQKLTKESKSQVNSLYRIVEGNSLLEILNYFELWRVQYIVVDLNRLQNEFGTFIPKIQSSTEFQNIWSTSFIQPFYLPLSLSKSWQIRLWYKWTCLSKTCFSRRNLLIYGIWSHY